ncbi:MAG: hypothetical protein AAGN64_03905, partial [Bacteroidota bacterium]
MFVLLSIVSGDSWFGLVFTYFSACIILILSRYVYNKNPNGKIIIALGSLSYILSYIGPYETFYPLWFIISIAALVIVYSMIVINVIPMQTINKSIVNLIFDVLFILSVVLIT